MPRPACTFFFFFNDTATTEIYTLSLHDALPIWPQVALVHTSSLASSSTRSGAWHSGQARMSSSQPSICMNSPYQEGSRSEEHTSELQSRLHLVCRLLLEKKKHITNTATVLC